MRPLKVLALMDADIISGPARQLAAVVPGLSKHGINVRIVCFSHRSRPESALSRFLTQKHVDHRIVLTDGRIGWPLITQVQQVIAEEKPDVVQTHSYRPAFIVWLVRKRLSLRYWIGFFHGVTHENLRVRIYNLIDRILLRQANHIVVVSRSQSGRFGSRARLSIIPNAVLTESKSADLSSPFRADLPRPIIGFVGRISTEKGWRYLMEALDRIRQSNVRFFLVVVGDGPDLSLMQRTVRGYGLEDSVVFLGRLDSVDAVYSHIDLLVLPSLTEGMPNVILEAASHDVPMVATSVGSVPEMLDDPDAGVVVPAADAGALAIAITYALNRGRTSAGTAARAAIAHKYSLDSRVQAHVFLYRGLVESQEQVL